MRISPKQLEITLQYLNARTAEVGLERVVEETTGIDPDNYHELEEWFVGTLDNPILGAAMLAGFNLGHVVGSGAIQAIEVKSDEDLDALTAELEGRGFTSFESVEEAAHAATQDLFVGDVDDSPHNTTND